MGGRNRLGGGENRELATCSRYARQSRQFRSRARQDRRETARRAVIGAASQRRSRQVRDRSSCADGSLAPGPSRCVRGRPHTDQLRGALPGGCTRPRPHSRREPPQRRRNLGPAPIQRRSDRGDGALGERAGPAGWDQNSSLADPDKRPGDPAPKRSGHAALRTLRDLSRSYPAALAQRAQRRALDKRLVTSAELGPDPDLTRSELERIVRRLCRRRRLPEPEVNAESGRQVTRSSGEVAQALRRVPDRRE